MCLLFPCCFGAPTNCRCWTADYLHVWPSKSPLTKTPHNLYALNTRLISSIACNVFQIRFYRVKRSYESAILNLTCLYCTLLITICTSYIPVSLNTHLYWHQLTMLLALALVGFVAIGLALVFTRASIVHQQTKGQIPVSVNYFFTRQCNKSCKSFKSTSCNPCLVAIR